MNMGILENLITFSYFCLVCKAKSVMMNAAVRMSVPIVSAQTVKQVHSEAVLHTMTPFLWMAVQLLLWFLYGVNNMERLYIYCLCTGCTQTLDVSSSGGDHQSDPPASHHASHTSATDPAQPHQPAAGHCARPRPRLWEHGLRCVAGPIRYAGPYVTPGAGRMSLVACISWTLSPCLFP